MDGGFVIGLPCFLCRGCLKVAHPCRALNRRGGRCPAQPSQRRTPWLAVQRRQIEGYATMKGFEAPKFFIEEGVSGTKPLGERPAGEELFAGLQRGDTIICAKLDRMFRSALDALQMVKEFKDKGVSLHLIDLGGDVAGNGISKLFFTIISAVAEAERDRIVQRILDVKSDQRRRGRHLGGKRPLARPIPARKSACFSRTRRALAKKGASVTAGSRGAGGRRGVAINAIPSPISMAPQQRILDLEVVILLYSYNPVQSCGTLETFTSLSKYRSEHIS